MKGRKKASLPLLVFGLLGLFVVFTLILLGLSVIANNTPPVDADFQEKRHITCSATVDADILTNTDLEEASCHFSQGSCLSPFGVFSTEGKVRVVDAAGRVASADYDLALSDSAIVIVEGCTFYDRVVVRLVEDGNIIEQAEVNIDG